MGRVFFNTRKNVHALNAAYTVLESDSGKVFMMSNSSGSGYSVTLPTTVANLEGFHLKFITVEDTPGNDITIAAGSAIIDGWSADAQGDIGVGTNNTPVSNVLIKQASKQGDSLDLMCDGTTWYFEARSQVHNGYATS